MDEIRTQPVGYLWQSGKDKNACPQCAALHGQMFYHDPQPGQASVADMPEPPLHPNCRCTRQPIVDILGEQFEIVHPTIPPYMEGKVKRGF